MTNREEEVIRQMKKEIAILLFEELFDAIDECVEVSRQDVWDALKDQMDEDEFELIEIMKSNDPKPIHVDHFEWRHNCEKQLEKRVRS